MSIVSKKPRASAYLLPYPIPYPTNLLKQPAAQKHRPPFTATASMSSMSTPVPAYSDDALGRFFLARQLARQAGDLVLSLRHPPPANPTATPTYSLSIDSKSASIDLVTSADLASQHLIFSGLSHHYPHHRLIGEEDAQPYGELDGKPTWIVDAVDGTTNFVHGLADWAISIAFCNNRVVELGVVYCPRSRDMFTAVRGRGAFLNDVPIRVSPVSRLADAMVVTEWGYQRDTDKVDRMLAVNRRLLQRNLRGPRQLGSGSLDMCYVAMGRVDAVYCGVAGEGWKIWDYAAASVVVEEAGGVLKDLGGGKFEICGESMLCAAPGIVDELLEAIQG